MKDLIIILMLISSQVLSYGQVNDTNNRSNANTDSIDVGFRLFKYDKENVGQFFVAAQVLGVKAGFMSNYGGSISAGLITSYIGPYIYTSPSISILRNQNLQWNIYPSIGFQSVAYLFSDRSQTTGLFGGGTDFSIGHVYLSFDIIYVSYYTDFNFRPGIGWRF